MAQCRLAPILLLKQSVHAPKNHSALHTYCNLAVLGETHHALPIFKLCPATRYVKSQGMPRSNLSTASSLIPACLCYTSNIAPYPVMPVLLEIIHAYNQHRNCLLGLTACSQPCTLTGCCHANQAMQSLALICCCHASWPQIVLVFNCLLLCKSASFVAYT